MEQSLGQVWFQCSSSWSCSLPHVGLLRAQGTLPSSEPTYGARPGTYSTGMLLASPLGSPKLSLSPAHQDPARPEPPPMRGRACSTHTPRADFH